VFFLKVLVAVDSFKGSLSAKEACSAIREGILRASSCANVEILPLADGGEGTVDAVSCIDGCETISVDTFDALMRSVKARYCILGDTAVMEMAAASGIMLLAKEELNPKITTTYGCGVMMKDALDRGISKIILGIGGSATNDGGAGALCALGAKLLDKSLQELSPGGAALKALHKIDMSGFDKRIRDTQITVACDVSVTLCGESGATKVFAKQKGADKSDILLLEEALLNYGKILQDTFMMPVFDIEGGGAAGGLGAMLCVCCGAALLPGLELIARLVRLEDRIRECDIVITGEGKTDASTLLGKLPIAVMRLAKSHTRPCILLSGDIDCESSLLYDAGFSQVFKARPNGVSTEYSMTHASRLLKKRAAEIFG
jgi:glycerate kinase